MVYIATISIMQVQREGTVYLQGLKGVCPELT